MRLWRWIYFCCCITYDKIKNVLIEKFRFIDRGENMFVIDVKYKTNLEIVDQYLAEHRTWLDGKYQEGLLLCSGPKNPRDGGLIIALGHDKAEVEALVREDPFYI